MAQARWKLTSFFIIVVVLAVHLMLASGVPLGVDEAHYALYALHPALSYFDHPPMVGWLQMLVKPLGYSEFSVRLIPALLYALASYLCFRLPRMLFVDDSGLKGVIAVFLLNTAPILQLMGWGLVPDLPLMVIALLSVEMTWRIHQSNRLVDWLMLGVLFGLAGLTKYTAVLLPVGLIGFLVQTRGLSWLRSPGPWLAAVVALVLISPVLIWNSQNDWVSLAYQFDRGVEVGHWSLKQAVIMQAALALLYSILAYVAAIAVTFSVIKQSFPDEYRAPASLILWSAWPGLIMVAWSAGGGAILPNWPAMMWTLMAPLSATWLSLHWRRTWVKVIGVLSSTVSIGAIVFVFYFLAFMPLSTFPFMKGVIKDLVGWRSAATHASHLLNNLEQEYDSDSGAILVENWVRASRLAWYAYPTPVMVISDQRSQFEFWYGKPNQQTLGILVRDNRTKPQDGDFEKLGIQCHFDSELTRKVEGIEVNHFDFYRCGLTDAPQQP